GFSRFPWASHALRGRSAASAAGPLQFFSWLFPVATRPNAAGRVSRLRKHRAQARPGLDAGALRHYIATPFQGGSQESRGTGAGRARRARAPEEAQGGSGEPPPGRRQVAKPPYRQERSDRQSPSGEGVATRRGASVLLRHLTPTTSLQCVDQICPRRIAAFRAQVTKGSGVLRPRKPL